MLKLVLYHLTPKSVYRKLVYCIDLCTECIYCTHFNDCDKVGCTAANLDLK